MAEYRSDERIVTDPAASTEELYRVAQRRPDLYPAIAAHPNTYPDLLTWLASLGDPAVNRALASRAAHTGPPATSPSRAAGASTQAGFAAGPVWQAGPTQVAGASSRTPLIVIIVVLVLLLVGLLWWQFLGSGGGTNRQAVQTSDADVTDPAIGEEATPTDLSDTKTATGEPGEIEEPTEEFTPGPYLPEAPTMVGLSSPSGNLACQAGEEGAYACTIYEYSFTSPAGCSGPVTVTVSGTGQVTQSCGAEAPRGGPVLDYEQTARLGDTAGCRSTEAGMRCWSGQTNTGVNIARAGITEIQGD